MKNSISNKRQLSTKQRDELLSALKDRFEKNLNRHKGLDWAKVQARLEANLEKLWSLNEMESTGGEPDVVGQDKNRVSSSSWIVPRKVRRAASVFATTAPASSNCSSRPTSSEPIWRICCIGIN